jgi:hypothetical protein
VEEPKEHETPEAIGAFLADLLVHARSYVLTNDEQTKAHGLKLLRSVCRAASHGRMPKGMRRHYEGLLRDLRPHVMALHRSGGTAPPDVLSEVDRIRSESKRGRLA